MMTLTSKNSPQAETSQTRSDRPAGGERRSAYRATREARMVVSNERCDMVETELLEHTTCGARVVLHGQAATGHRVDFQLTTRTSCLDGFARVAWTLPLANGRAIAGLEFVDFTMTSVRK